MFNWRLNLAGIKREERSKAKENHDAEITLIEFESQLQKLVIHLQLHY